MKHRLAPSYEEYRKTDHFGALNGMRAIGVLLVMFEHYGGEKLKCLSGWLGVHIFFVISGFLITTLLLREQEKHGSVSLRDFYIRRIFRIFPVYFLILIIVVFQTYRFGGELWQQLKHALPYYATFLNELSLNTSAPWQITWTMGIECKFYLMWSMIAFLIPLSQKGIALITLVTLLFLSWFWSSPIVTAPHYIVLLFGAMIAILLHNKKTFNVLRCLMNPVASLCLCMCVIVMQLYGIHQSFAGGYGGGRGVVIYGLVVAVFLPTLIGFSPLNTLLKSRPFMFIGTRSYSLYLVQVLAWQMFSGVFLIGPCNRNIFSLFTEYMPLSPLEYFVDQVHILFDENLENHNNLKDNP